MVRPSQMSEKAKDIYIGTANPRFLRTGLFSDPREVSLRYGMKLWMADPDARTEGK